jgi:hypothetical protein
VKAGIWVLVEKLHAAGLTLTYEGPVTSPLEMIYSLVVVGAGCSAAPAGPQVVCMTLVAGEPARCLKSKMHAMPGVAGLLLGLPA